MTVQTSRWFEYGEPVGQRVEATIRTTYETGPNEEPRGDDVQRGTVAFEALELMQDSEEIAAHTHDDGAVLLSALSDDAESELLETFEPMGDIERLIRAGCSPSEAVDYLMVEERGYTQSAWADVRSIGQSSVSGNVAGAKDELSE
jgi:hypothetical protein